MLENNTEVINVIHNNNGEITLEVESKRVVRKTYFLKRNGKRKKFVVKVNINKKKNYEIEVHKTEAVVDIFVKN